MAVRIISGVVGLPILLAIVLLGGIWLKLGVLFVSLIGMYEFYKAVSKKIMPIHFIGFLMEILYIFFIDIQISERTRLLLSVCIVLILISTVFMHTKINIIDAAVTLFGFFYIGFLLANIWLIKNSFYGEFTVWLVFICAWCCDTGAYFTGVKFGKHKMTPILSPHKTIEGAIGGVVFTALFSSLYGFIISKYFMMQEINMAFICGIIGLIGSIFSQLGDLAASSIKRYTEIKDFGKIMPGHGGILDRFDSVIVTSPVVYVLTQLMLENLK